MEFYKTERNGHILSLNGFEYILRSDSEGFQQWRCRQYRKFRCNSKMTTQGSKTIMKNPTDHCHEGDPFSAIVNSTLTHMKTNIKASGSATRNIIGSHVQHLSTNEISHLPTKAALERTLQNIKRKTNNFPPNPQNTIFEIPEVFKAFVLYDSRAINDNKRIISLGDRELLNYLDGTNWFADGTFKVSPEIFYQLYTIHAQIGNTYIACIYFLLPNKTSETYKRMIDILKSLVPSCKPKMVLLDFEMGPINIFQDAFKDISIYGCYFHLSQAVIRKLQEIGLKKKYETDSDFKILVKCLLSLSFVPINDVPALFDLITENFPDDDICNSLLEYFQSTYVRGTVIVRRQQEPRYPIKLWNHYENTIQSVPKTTNCCEGFHNALRSIFLCSHPTIWTLFSGLQKDVGINKLKASNYELNQEKPSKKKYCILAKRMQDLVSRYHEFDDKMKYLRNIALMQ
jgi:hypothetical protein